MNRKQARYHYIDQYEIALDSAISEMHYSRKEARIFAEAAAEEYLQNMDEEERRVIEDRADCLIETTELAKKAGCVVRSQYDKNQIALYAEKLYREKNSIYRTQVYYKNLDLVKRAMERCFETRHEARKAEYEAWANYLTDNPQMMTFGCRICGTGPQLTFIHR